MVIENTLNTFDDIYKKTYDKVLKYVVLNCKNAEDVSDIVQNIYLELLKKINANYIFNNEISYVIGIAKNKINEYYRFKYRVNIVSLLKKDEDTNYDIPDDFDLQENFIKNEDIKFVWNYLKNKKVIIFKIFYLYYYDGLSIKNIAEELNLSVSNVKHYLYRTLNELKIIMKKRGE